MDKAVALNPQGYNEFIKKKVLVLIALAVLALGVALLSILAGSSGLTLGEVFASLFGQGTAKTNAIVWNVRLPRIVTAMVVGGALAMSGCVMQSVLRNPLASASTLGVSQGAAFGATAAIILFGAGVQNSASAASAISISNPYLVTLCAFGGGIISTLVVLGLSRVRRISPQSMVLAGVALSSLFTGGTTLLQYFADDVQVAAVVFWTFGDLGRTSWQEIALIAGISLAAGLYFFANRWNYNAMEAGPHTAQSLGVNVGAVMLAGMTVSSLVASTAVSFVGIINFVGLVAPHMVRKFVGNDYRFLLPASMLMGMVILLVSDLAGRLAVAPVILPIGAITSFLGAPLFLYMIFKGVR
ncbi:MULTISPECIES: iron ABC transporter permease [unclassified Clostridium]|uniref:FecCD family ABC transporter permease n=1 Tax=unclassified Clostridium TaxID=2614128 RepID=UPI001A9B8397|nr:MULTISPECIES: iron ABC transporter permease [unclassified Clostridium]